MLLRRVSLENIRSFLDRADLYIDGAISIVIGPNGGGKTNLLDAVVIILRRYMFASVYAVHAPTEEQSERYEFRPNDALNHMVLEKHSLAAATAIQRIEIEVEVTSVDIANMESMKRDVTRILELAEKKYFNLALREALGWDLSRLSAGVRLVYIWENKQLNGDGTPASTQFLQYLRLFEVDSRLREEYELSPLSTPIVYLPVNRSAGGFQSTVELAGYNEFELKRHSDATFSRSATQIVNLAIGRLAQRYRLLLEKDKGIAAQEFRTDPNIKELTAILRELGYEWSLESVNPLKNQYDIRLKKQGTSFLVGAASSGERELLTYLFAIFALNVRDALIIVDEPELHLHPKWQQVLLQLFVRLAKSTGNQFLLATHSPVFVSPDSIHYVSRVFSLKQRSRIQRLNSSDLPDARHLFNIVNSQNNERLFFADHVVLVEGLSDRIVFETLLKLPRWKISTPLITEVVSVGGKHFIPAYVKVLKACQIPFSIVADLDYVEQIGPAELKALFTIDKGEIKEDVIDNPKSIDADTLVSAIEEALRTGTWEGAKEIWNYIQSRRRQLRPNLTSAERLDLDTFLVSKRRERVYVLSRGAIEAYLPAGYGKKRLDNLIRLVSKPLFWAALRHSGKTELQEIVTSILTPPREDSAIT